MAFLPKVKKLCHKPFFLEAFVAPLFLDIYIEIFGVWANHKYISNSDIFKEDTIGFAKDGLLTQKLLSLRKHSSSSFFHTLIHWYQWHQCRYLEL